MTRLMLFVGYLGLLAALAGVLAAPNAGLDQVDRAPPITHSARASFKLPKLFDFANFKRLFKTSYSSIVEELVRQKLFYARAFRAFTSAIKYKHRTSSYYLKVNSMSDWTAEEIEAIKMRPEGQPSLDTAREMVIDDIEATFEEIKLHEHEPGYEQIVAELNRRQKRAANERELDDDDLIGDPSEGELVPEKAKAKVVLRPASNNPNYEEPELLSFGLDDGELSAGQKSSNQSYFISYLNKIKEESYNTTERQWLKKSIVSLAKKMSLFDPSELPDKVFVDHRESGCFFKPRNQKRCGSCYAFAAVALAEFINCKETGELTPFSEQYLVDCAKGYENMDGCDGAPTVPTIKFIINYGVELRTNYPYRARETGCPYGSVVEPTNERREKMGYMRPHEAVDWQYTTKGHAENYLANTPFYATLSSPPDFNEYGGGVHSGAGCNATVTDHAVLLVGHGREDGREYWLIRNSYSASFGEGGYYKLDKKSPCLGRYLITIGRNVRRPKLSLKSNTKYDVEPLERKKKELAHDFPFKFWFRT